MSRWLRSSTTLSIDAAVARLEEVIGDLTLRLLLMKPPRVPAIESWLTPAREESSPNSRVSYLTV